MSFLLLALFSESAAIIARLSIVYKYFLKRNSSSIQFVENMWDSSLKWKRNIFVNRNRHFAPAMTFLIRWYLKYAFKRRISVEFAEKRQINHNNLRKNSNYYWKGGQIIGTIPSSSLKTTFWAIWWEKQ